MRKLYLSRSLRFLTALVLGLFTIFAFGQKEKDKDSNPFAKLQFRSIGPAFMSGRIADIAIDPNNDNIWFVAAGSGGVWKTINNGTTFKPIFDKYSSYSTGALAIDPQNSQRIWLGTGENVGGRHAGYGDGIYLSVNGGKTWRNMGLSETEHISKIIVHPNNSQVVWVAAQGPLWNKGGQRGLYKTSNGGKDWKRILEVNPWTGVTDLVQDSRNPEVLYAATWQRHRTVAAFLGGGKGSGIYRSMDGGENWEKLSQGLPKMRMGKIGLAIAPQNPDVIYAAIEGYHREGSVYRSKNKGGSWQKLSETVSGAIGPHYYQELYASPHHPNTLYLMDVRAQISEDGGKTFRRISEEHKHSDNHALAFKKSDPNYLLMGTDGGLYESFDHGESWRFIKNLPLTQFYKLALDDAEPFYHIMGGTQDNNTQWGPSRTNNVHGIQNRDWKIVLGGDGHQPAFEPGNPHIAYAQWQEGHLNRIDLTTGENTGIQPQPAQNEPFERFNWDAPILISPHDSQRVYFASQRLWRSDNRGDVWRPVSPDLTKNQERLNLPIMGGEQAWNNAWDVYAMSNFNTITAIAESPLQEGHIMIGTDDGLLHLTKNGGADWQEIKRSNLPGAPVLAYVNDIKADLHDAHTFYVALDNHKYGDFAPYLYKTTDGGKSWESLHSNLPSRHIIWRVVQDHINPQLLFAATELGVFFTLNGGQTWKALKGGIPTIAVRDLQIQRQHDDLVCATFGRGFYIMDDIAPLRHFEETQLKKEAHLYPLRDAYWYIPKPVLSTRSSRGSQGASHFVAPNPPFGANFTYYLGKGFYTQKELRFQAEKSNPGKAGFPGWDTLQEEEEEAKPELMLWIRNEKGKVIRKLKVSRDSGFHRANWDLRYASKRPLSPGTQKVDSAFLVPPGKYSARLMLAQDGAVRSLGDAVSFAVKPINKGALQNPRGSQRDAFWEFYENTRSEYRILQKQLSRLNERHVALGTALRATAAADSTFYGKWESLHHGVKNLHYQVNGNPAKGKVGEKSKPNLSQRMRVLGRIVGRSTYGPTGTAMDIKEIVEEQLLAFQKELKVLKEQQEALIKKLREAGGAPILD